MVLRSWRTAATLLAFSTITSLLLSACAAPKYTPPGCVLQDVKTVAEFVERRRLPSHTGTVVLVNHLLAGWGTELQPGDVTSLIPAIGGGR